MRYVVSIVRYGVDIVICVVRMVRYVICIVCYVVDIEACDGYLN